MSDNPEPAEPAIEPVADPRADAVEAMLRDWVEAQIHNSPISREVEALNYFTTTALPDLRRRILSEV